MTETEQPKPASELSSAAETSRRRRLPESLAFDAVVRELEELPKATAIAVLELVRVTQQAREG